MARRIGFEFEQARGFVGLEHRDGMIDDLAGFGVHLADILAAEIGVPDLAVMDDDVVRASALQGDGQVSSS